MWIVLLLMIPCVVGTLGQWFGDLKSDGSHCLIYEFPCLDNGECFNKQQWCDGNHNCQDQSDETNCNSYSACNEDVHFKCDHGACIPLKGRCDGYPSCPDGSDELDCPCENVYADSGSIEYMVHAGIKRIAKCWKIAVPSNKYLSMRLKELNLQSKDCSKEYLTVTFEKSNAQAQPIKICPGKDIHELKQIETFDDTEIRYRSSSRGHSRDSRGHSGEIYDTFEISYTVEDILCKESDSFKCSPHVCIQPEKKCDGVKDCFNGADERRCERGVHAVPGVNGTRTRGLKGLKKERNAAWGWRDNTHRAVVALYLSEGANFNGSNQEEDLTAKQLELQMTTAILRNETDPITTTQLAMYLNALLVICHDPRNFYGFNLVKILQNQLDFSTTSYHPLPYLALCNANETLSDAALGNLSALLESPSNHSFLTDIQSVAIMALSCVSNNGKFSYLKENISNATARFKKEQYEDGSFGNIYTTALVIQALLSSGSEEDKDWNLKAAIEFLQKKQNKIDGLFEDFLATYLVLPILNAKSLSDIGKINCTENLKMPRDGNPISDIEYKLGQKIFVTYSLYVGDQKDQIHPISLRTPTNITVLDVMRLASEADPKYRFEAQNKKGKLYIYKLFGIANDPEDGKFWLLFSGSENSTVKITSKSPDKVPVHDKDNIIMWYMSAESNAVFEINQM